MMKHYKLISLGLAFLTNVILGACSQNDSVNDDFGNHLESNLIIFDAQAGNMVFGSHAADEGEITPLAVGTRFALRMYYDNRSTADTATTYNAIETACMQVTAAGERCKYYTTSYDKNDEDTGYTGSKLYWNNRKYHGFIGFFLNNEATTGEPAFILPTETKRTYSLDFQTDESDKTKKFQDDPMLAVLQKRPTGGTNEANRVVLTFEHQTACVIIRVKSDKESVERPVGEGEIQEIAKVTDVALLGTAKKITVNTALIEKNKVFIHEPSIASNDTIGDLHLPIDKTPYEGFNASAQGLAFGYLRGIAINWEEHHKDEDTDDPVIVHSIRYSFGDSESTWRRLESGKKYIYNITLRRGTIATINLEIIDWDKDDKVYNSDGVIIPKSTKTIIE